MSSSDDLRVLFVTPSATFGGAERKLLDWCRNLPAEGVRPLVASFEEGELVDRLREADVPVHVVPVGRLRRPDRGVQGATALVRAARPFAPDLVFANQPKAHLYTWWVARRLGVPAVWSQVNVPDDAGPLDRVASRLPGAAVVANGAATATAQARLPGSPPVHVVHPGTDVQAFRPDVPSDVRAELGVADGRPLVGIVGRLQRWKGHAAVLDAMRLVVDQHPDAHLVVVGGESPGLDAGWADALEGRAAALGLAGHTTFTGHRADVPAWMAACDVVVNASAPEPFGHVVTEAMACGTPVVAVDAGGPAEVVDHGRTGLLVAEPDPLELAGALGRLLGDPVGARRMGAAGRELVVRRFSSVASAQRLASVLRTVAAGGDPDPATGTRRRVVYLTHCARLSGGELALARQLPALDVDAHVILGEHGPMEQRFVAAGATVEVLDLGATGDTRRREVRVGRAAARQAWHTVAHVRRLRRRLLALDPDLVHTSSLKAAVYGGIAGRAAGVPVVWHVRDRIAADYLPTPAVHLVRGLSRVLPAAVVANAETTLATVPGGRVRAVVPSPAAPHRPQPPSPSAAPATHPAGHRRVGLPLRVAMVGRLAPWKGQHVFVEAFAKAFPEGGPTAVVAGEALFGEQAYAAEVHALAVDLGIDRRLTFAGFVADVPTLLAGCDVLVHASVLPEPFGQVVVEGMAAGLAVVAARAGGPAEVITDGVDGLLVPPGDVAALAACLERLAEDADLRHDLSLAARASAQRYTSEAVAPKVHAVYDAVLRPRRGRAEVAP